MLELFGQLARIIENKKKSKMPILADLSRRFHILTTDAKPDPPRANINGDSNTSAANLNDTTSALSIAENAANGDDSNDLLRKRENSSSIGGNPTSAGTAKDDKKRENPRSKRATHSGQAKNIFNYNIVNSNGVKIGGTTTYVCNINQYGKNRKDSDGKNSATATSSVKPMPENVKMLCDSTDELTIKHMFLIKTHVDNDWRKIFKSLGYSKGQLDQFEESYKSKGMDEMIYQILLDWKRENGKDAHIGRIVKTLWQCQQYDCVERLCADNES